MTPFSTPSLEFARSVLQAQPFSVLLGARLMSFGDGEAVIEIDVREELRQQHGFVHGGLVSYLIDNATTFAAGTVLGTDLVTAGFTVDYLRPARGARLHARAVVVRAGSGLAVLRCDVHTLDAGGNGDGAGKATLCAVGQGRVSVRRNWRVGAISTLEEEDLPHASAVAHRQHTTTPSCRARAGAVRSRVVVSLLLLIVSACAHAKPGETTPNVDVPERAVAMPVGSLAAVAWLPDGHLYVDWGPDGGSDSQIWRVAATGGVHAQGCGLPTIRAVGRPASSTPQRCPMGGSA